MLKTKVGERGPTLLPSRILLRECRRDSLGLENHLSAARYGACFYSSAAASVQQLLATRYTPITKTSTRVSLADPKKVPSRYWVDGSHHRELFDHLGSLLGIQQV